MDSSNIIRGSCNCGNVAVSMTKNVFPSSCSLCHCLNCRASSGSLFAVNIPVPKDAVKIEGTPKVYVDTGGSGKSVHRHFCGDCGSFGLDEESCGKFCLIGQIT
ncbi:Mss4-like protein [Lophiotrema nucula]|uniref:Mss4-like protein n=1 Tax=Lophiotrema nucula TaxID=690887 RepID=A0A6A5Z6F7_9PLEO|nr:Mss4-like protein [Lophiotrema nucula]